MKLCLATYNNRLASLFDNCTCLLLFEKNKQELWEQTGEIRVSKQGGDYCRVKLLLDFGVQILICGAMSGCTRRMLQSSGIQVLDWVRGDIQEVLAAWNDRDMSALVMPGCRQRRRNCSLAGHGQKVTGIQFASNVQGDLDPKEGG